MEVRASRFRKNDTSWNYIQCLPRRAPEVVAMLGSDSLEETLISYVSSARSLNFGFWYYILLLARVDRI